jgi:hypothetical protein
MIFFPPSFPRKRESMLIFKRVQKMDSRFRGNDDKEKASEEQDA